MTQLQNIKIENFRGFDSINIDDFGKINVFVGKNNCGKTSILESIFLLTGATNPAILSYLLLLRGLSDVKNIASYKNLFYQFDYSKIINIESEFTDAVNRQITIAPKFDATNIDTIANFSSSLALHNLTNLEIKYLRELIHRNSINSNTMYHYPNIKYLLFDTINPYPLGDQDKNISSSFIHSKTNGIALEKFSELVKRKKTKEVIEILQKVDPKIISIQQVPDGIYFEYENLNELLHTSSIGDGVNKLLNIVVELVSHPNSIFLIDEFENGLHYSSQRILWRNLLTLTKEYDTQFFITTHSIEALKIFKEVLEEENYSNMQGESRIYNIASTKKAGFQAYKYGFEAFKSVIEYDNEIRG